jgi:hypothetical protein
VPERLKLPVSAFNQARYICARLQHLVSGQCAANGDMPAPFKLQMNSRSCGHGPLVALAAAFNADITGAQKHVRGLALLLLDLTAVPAATCLV